MNHYAWTYVAGGGRNTKVGLYHGGQTGHVLIYAGKKIVTIDFKVFDSKEYSFFIDEELCRIKLERRGDQMFYFFEIDKKADTPLNRARWAREKKHLRQMLIALGAVGLLMGAVAWWLGNGNWAANAERQLAKKGRETVGRLTAVSENGSEIRFQFVAGSEAHTGSLQKGRPLPRPTANGMPLEPGDEFTVRYLPGRPSTNRIFLGQPTARQVEIYRQRAAQRHLELHPGLSEREAECLVGLAYATDGLNGLAHYYFQATPPGENPSHNDATYRKFTTAQPYREKAKRRCASK